MSDTLSPEVERLLQEQIDGQQFTSANDVLLVALRLFKEYQAYYPHQVGEQIKEGFDEIERGECIELKDAKELRAFFDDIQQRGRQRYEASKTG